MNYYKEIDLLKENLESKIRASEEIMKRSTDANAMLKLIGMQDGFQYCLDEINNITERAKPSKTLTIAAIIGATIGTLLAIIISIKFF